VAVVLAAVEVPIFLVEVEPQAKVLLEKHNQQMVAAAAVLARPVAQMAHIKVVMVFRLQ
jgi:hypothetical protein